VDQPLLYNLIMQMYHGQELPEESGREP
jgi:hypothetical protein